MSNVIIYDTYNVNVTIENDEVVGVQVVAGFIHDVIAGTNISIDKTDPLNPVISSTGGGADLSNGNGTTANGTSVDLGGTITGNVNIDGAFDFKIGNITPPLNILFQARDRFSIDALLGLNFTEIYGTSTEIGFLLNGATKLNFSNSGTILNLGSDAAGDTYYRNSSGYLTRLAAGTNGHVLTLSGGLPSWAAPSGGGTWGSITGTLSSQTDLQTALDGKYSLASGGTFTGPNTFNGTTTNILKGVYNSLGTTQTNGAGLWLANTTAAAAGAQQRSPSLVFEGQGWKTNATAASQSVKFITDVLPVQGSANPSGYLSTASSINGAAYSEQYRLYSDGDAVLLNRSTTAGRGFAVYDNGGTERGVMKLYPLTHFEVGAASGYPLRLVGGAAFGMLVSTTGNVQINSSTTVSNTAKLLVGGTVNATIPVLRLDGPVHTNLTASTEHHEVNFALDRVKTFAAGALTTQREFIIKGPTYAFASSSTLTNAYTVYIDKPTAGTKATITNNYALGTGGNINVGGAITASGDITTNGDSRSRQIIRHITSIVSATTSTKEIVDVTEISDGDAVMIEIFYVLKDDNTNTGAGGTFTAIWTKAAGSIQKVGESGTAPTLNDTGGTFTLSSADNSGSIDFTITESGVSGNFSCALVCKITFYKA